MVLRHVAALLLAVLKQREFSDPQKIEGAGLNEAELLGEVITQLAQRIIDDLILGVGDDEQQVALFGLQCLVNSAISSSVRNFSKLEVRPLVVQRV